MSHMASLIEGGMSHRDAVAQVFKDTRRAPSHASFHSQGSFTCAFVESLSVRISVIYCCCYYTCITTLNILLSF